MLLQNLGGQTKSIMIFFEVAYETRPKGPLIEAGSDRTPGRIGSDRTVRIGHVTSPELTWWRVKYVHNLL